MFLRWRDPGVHRTGVVQGQGAGLLADLLDDGAEAATAHTRLKGVRRFSACLAAEGELPEDPLTGMPSSSSTAR
jgi:hypothetical protein